MVGWRSIGERGSVGFRVERAAFEFWNELKIIQYFAMLYLIVWFFEFK